MRQLTDAGRLRQFLRALGAEAHSRGRIYLTGGATAVLYGWRDSTIDVDMKLSPPLESLLRVVPRLKEELQINVELASPGDFIPELPGWEDRSVFIVSEGRVDFYHYDFYSQALSKIERGHARDLDDVRQMAAHGLIVPARLQTFFETIVPELYRYSAIDPPAFARAVERAVRTLEHVGD